MEILAQGVGILGMIASTASFQLKRYKSIMLMQAVTSTIFSINFLLLYLCGTDTALTAALIQCLLVVRDLVFIYLSEKGKKNVMATMIFMALVMTFGFVSWGGYTSLLYIIAMCMNTYSFAMNNPQKVRILMMVYVPFALAYDILTLSIGAICSETLALGSVIIGYIRYREKKQ